MRYMDGGRRRLEGEHPGCVAHKPPRCSAVVVARSGASLPREGRRTGAVVVVAVGRARRRGGKRGEEGGRRRTVTLTGWYTLLSLYCVVPTGAGRSFGAGGASRTGRAKPCEGCGRLGYGGGAVVPASGTAACSSEVAAGPEMETVLGAGSALVASMGI